MNKILQIFCANQIQSIQSKSNCQNPGVRYATDCNLPLLKSWKSHFSSISKYQGDADVIQALPGGNSMNGHQGLSARLMEQCSPCRSICSSTKLLWLIWRGRGHAATELTEHTTDLMSEHHDEWQWDIVATPSKSCVNAVLVPNLTAHTSPAVWMVHCAVTYIMLPIATL